MGTGLNDISLNLSMWLSGWILREDIVAAVSAKLRVVTKITKSCLFSTKLQMRYRRFLRLLTQHWSIFVHAATANFHE